MWRRKGLVKAVRLFALDKWMLGVLWYTTVKYQNEISKMSEGLEYGEMALSVVNQIIE